MAKNKIERKSLRVKSSAEVSHVSPSKSLVIYIPNGNDIEVPELRNLDYPELIVRELNLFLRGQEKARGVANSILLYLRHVVAAQGTVGILTLESYKASIDNRNDIILNTKGQKLGDAKRFVSHLMAADIFDHDELPRNFAREDVQHKGTFLDAVRYRLPELTSGMKGDVNEKMVRLNIEEHGAQALVFGRRCMSSLRQCAESHVKATIADWAFVSEIVEGLDDEETRRLRGYDFSQSKNKSIQLAIAILYSHFGRAVPSSTEWPKGVSDWVRKRGGWPISRIEAGLFLNVTALDAFFVLILADERLSPNVDSVAFYAYLDCCVPSSEKYFYDVFFRKKRGSSPTVTIPESDITVTALRALVNQVRAFLPEMPGGEALMGNEHVPIFVHCKKSVTRSVDPGMTSYMVKRFIKSAAKEFSVLEPLVDVVTGENFRPTHAYLKKLSGESSYKIKGELGHQNLSTTEGYIQGVETQAIQNRRQQDFQRYLVDEARTEKRTGSGYLCGGGLDKEGCIEFMDCSQCEAKRVVLSDANIAAEWIAWERKILSDKVRLRTENLSRWNFYWEPRLTEYQTLITLTKSVTLHRAKIISEGISLPWLS